MRGLRISKPLVLTRELILEINDYNTGVQRSRREYYRYPTSNRNYGWASSELPLPAADEGRCEGAA